VTARVARDQLERLFDPTAQLTHVSTVFERLGLS
jgi:hypothetical protein